MSFVSRSITRSASRLNLPTSRITSSAVVAPLRTAPFAVRTIVPATKHTVPTFGSRLARFSTMPSLQKPEGATPVVNDNMAPEVDKVLKDIADYVHDYKIESPLAWETARLCLIDTLGCGLEALNFEQCTKLLGPVIPGTIVPNGTRVPGTPYQLDPVRGAFNIGTAIRWLDYNDCWLAAEWGHPSDNLGGILAVADWLARTAKADPSLGIQVPKVKDVLEAMIKAHEIQGCLALENSFNRVGLDHVVLVKVATTAVVSKLLGCTREQTIDAVSQAWVDGQSLRTYRHAPNTMSRKSWAAGDACSRAVNLALMVKIGGVQGIKSVLTAKTWGFYDVLFKGKEFKYQRPYGSYVMENVLFKISYPAEFHSQTACEAAMTLHHKLKEAGKTIEDIKHIRIRTQDAAIRIIDKKGPLHNYADRDHCIQYMVAIPLIFGRLTTKDYSDDVAADPRIDALRDKMECIEDTRFSAEYHHPDKRSIGNAILITFNDGTTLPEVEVEYPIGHKFRREEGIPLLMEKFARHLRGRFDENKSRNIEQASEKGKVEGMDVDAYVDLYVIKQ
ncbi:MmgE/PrpD family-domain-containing protein [Kalaharituber pfeilii]|nr:MmgE/PrpD family-domain-containing protein [Kalaharituber pfeilii]